MDNKNPIQVEDRFFGVLELNKMTFHRVLTASENALRKFCINCKKEPQNIIILQIRTLFYINSVLFLHFFTNYNGL